MANNYNNYGNYGFQNEAQQAYINQLQNYTQQLQREVQQLRQSMNGVSAPPTQQNNQEQRNLELSLPVRHADIMQIKEKKQVLDDPIDPGQSKMYMTEDESIVFIKSMEKDGKTYLRSYMDQGPEDISGANEYVTKDTLKELLSSAVSDFSKLVPKSDDFVRKDEIRDIIVETLSSSRSKRKDDAE